MKTICVTKCTFSLPLKINLFKSCITLDNILYGWHATIINLTYFEYEIFKKKTHC